jgi:hypothetical protein
MGHLVIFHQLVVFHPFENLFIVCARMIGSGAIIDFFLTHEGANMCI